MKLLMFSVYDSMVEAYMPPFFVRARGEALRLFGDLVNDQSSNVGKHPSDFTLMYIGEWDDGSGRVDDSGITVRVISGLECLNSPVAAEALDSASRKARLDSLGPNGR